ncbi:SDR family NAD(P)-dependent oxidoreductase [bacterium]|nr:SDR family NAD(P)-dependent oxidoreductase [bacterium]
MNIVVFGASGAIGSEFVTQLSKKYPEAKVYAFSRKVSGREVGNIHFESVDFSSEEALAHAASSIEGSIDILIVATGMLHGEGVMPEKSIDEVSLEKFQLLYEVNAVYPMLIAKHFLPKLSAESPTFAILSARIGSISDNHLGGWYAYRASKAAINMLIKTLSIEFARKNKEGKVVGLHPGTVDSALSKPFQGNVVAGKLFAPRQAVESLLQVLDQITKEDSGKCFGWDGKEIEP